MGNVTDAGAPDHAGKCTVQGPPRTIGAGSKSIDVAKKLSMGLGCKLYSPVA